MAVLAIVELCSQHIQLFFKFSALLRHLLLDPVDFSVGIFLGRVRLLLNSVQLLQRLLLFV